MEEKDITANMARETMARQSNEDEVTAVFRLHILRFWSHERIENFCLHLLGVDVHEYRAWRKAVEQSVQADVLITCAKCGQYHSIYIPCPADTAQPAHR